MTVRALIADDSEFFREVLKEELERDSDILVVGEAADGLEAIKEAERTRADLVTIDIRMPSMGGLEAITELMARHPVPIVVITSQPVSGSTLVFEATRRGALAVLEKGVVARRGAWLREQIRLLAKVKVVRHLKSAKAQPAEARPPVSFRVGGRRLIGIGASAGGPPAVAQVLSALPSDFPGCIAVVQHLSNGFARSYARFLQQSTPLRVQIAEGPCGIEAGLVLVAPDDRHLILQGDRFELSQAPPDAGLRPSVDALFSSLASAPSAAVGVILSGMGDDGATGAERLAMAGGLVIVQDEETSTVFGMPKAAARAAPGAHVLPVQEIGSALIRATSRREVPR